MIRTQVSSLNLHVRLGLDLVLCVYRFVCSCISVDDFIPVLLTVVVLGLVSQHQPRDLLGRTSPK